MTPPFKCILSKLNSQGDFGVWLLTLAFILLFIACLSHVTLLLLHMAWKRELGIQIHKYFQLQVQCMIDYVNMLNEDHFMNKLSFTSMLTI